MADWWRLLFNAGAASAGVAVGYAAERLLVHGRIDQPSPGPPLGEEAGDLSTIDGPDGSKLAVEYYGPPDAQQVMLVHGFSMSGRSWHEQVVALRDRFRLITYDQPGHARSSKPDSGEYSLDLLADGLAAVVEQATDPSRGPLVLVGHSMGGMTALCFARCHSDLFDRRVGALLLLSTCAKAGVEDVAMGLGIQLLVRIQSLVERGASLLGPRAHYLARAYRSSSDLSFALVRELALIRTADPRHVDLTEQLVLDSDLGMLTKLTPVLLTMDEEETLAGIEVPTIVLCGVGDRMTPVEYTRHMAEVNSDLEVVELPGIGHMTPLEAHVAVNALIVQLAGMVAEKSAPVVADG